MRFINIRLYKFILHFDRIIYKQFTSFLIIYRISWIIFLECIMNAKHEYKWLNTNDWIQMVLYHCRYQRHR